MRFSILIPTKDRLEYLRYAVESVRRQDFGDWDLIVADNASSEDVAGFLQEVGDDRISYIRSDVPLSVTDNWNVAMAASSGTYVLMLGDDDALLPGYLTAVDRVAAEHADPALVYTGALLYCYPGVEAAHPNGYLRPYAYASFLQGRTTPFLLDPAVAKRGVEDFLRFRVSYGYNMQFALFHRSLIEDLERRGEVYQSPFPDYYAMNAAMLSAGRILVTPGIGPLIGITPKSYGYFLQNEVEEQGRQFLDGQSVNRDEGEQGILPGTNINTSWLRAARTLVARFPELELKVSLRRYRALQALEVQKALVSGAADLETEGQLRAKLSWLERLIRYVVLCAPTRLPLVSNRLRGGYLRRLGNRFGQFIEFEYEDLPGRFSNALDVIDHLAETSRHPS